MFKASEDVIIVLNSVEQGMRGPVRQEVGGKYVGETPQGIFVDIPVGVSMPAHTRFVPWLNVHSVVVPPKRSLQPANEE